MTKEEKQKAITTAGNPAKPTGEAGEQMLARMNESHAPPQPGASRTSPGAAMKPSSTSAAAAVPISIA